MTAELAALAKDKRADAAAAAGPRRLGFIGPDAKDAVEALKAAAKDEDANVARAAADLATKLIDDRPE